MFQEGRLSNGLNSSHRWNNGRLSLTTHTRSAIARLWQSKQTTRGFSILVGSFDSRCQMSSCIYQRYGFAFVEFCHCDSYLITRPARSRQHVGWNCDARTLRILDLSPDCVDRCGIAYSAAIIGWQICSYDLLDALLLFVGMTKGGSEKVAGSQGVFLTRVWALSAQFTA
jgi:hypothetical protein